MKTKGFLYLNVIELTYAWERFAINYKDDFIKKNIQNIWA